MSFSIKEWIFGGKTFCFCLPTRLGAIFLSFLTLLLAGILSVVLWFEVTSTTTMSSTERVAFIVAGVVETLLFLASILGFAGAVVRKQLFVTIYAWFIYAHFLLNVGIAGYLLYEITHAGNVDVAKGCREGLRDSEAQGQCEGLLKIAKAIYFVIAAAILLAEMYAAIVVTRYLRQLRFEKRRGRARAMRSSSSQPSFMQKHEHHPSEDLALLSQTSFAARPREFNPYADYQDSTSAAGPSVQPHAVDEGYGGGRWTYDEIKADEKPRMSVEERAVHEEEDIGIHHKDRLPSPAPCIPALSSGPSLMEMTSSTGVSNNLPQATRLSDEPPPYVHADGAGSPFILDGKARH